VNRAIQCGFAHVSTANEFHESCGRNISLTEFEEIYPRLVAPDVEIIIQEAAFFKAQLGEVMSTVVPKYY
jgi:hypothetical protein